MRNGELPNCNDLILRQITGRDKWLPHKREPPANRLDRMCQTLDIDQARLLAKRVADGTDLIEAGLAEYLVALNTDDDNRVVAEERLYPIVGFQVPLVRLEQRQRVGIDADLRRLPYYRDGTQQEHGEQPSREKHERIPGGIHAGGVAQVTSATSGHFHWPKAALATGVCEPLRPGCLSPAPRRDWRGCCSSTPSQTRRHLR